MSEQEQEEKRFEELYRTYYTNLCRYATGLMKNYGTAEQQLSGKAEEVVQETFSVAWMKRDIFLASENPVGWLYNALHFKLQEINRDDQKWKKRVLKLSELSDSQSGASFGLRSELFNVLSEEEYSLLKKVYLDGYSYRELSRVTGIKQSTLAMRVKRAKERLGKEIGER